MAKQRIINTKFWSDGYILDLDPIERYIFLYLLTNEHTNISGVYEIPVRRMAQETGIDAEMLEKILARFQNDAKVYYRTGWVMIKNFAKHQSTTSKTVQDAIAINLKQVPAEIINDFRQKDQEFDRVCIGYHILLPKLKLKDNDCGKVDNPNEGSKKLEEMKKQFNFKK